MTAPTNAEAPDGADREVIIPIEPEAMKRFVAQFGSSDVGKAASPGEIAERDAFLRDLGQRVHELRLQYVAILEQGDRLQAELAQRNRELLDLDKRRGELYTAMRAVGLPPDLLDSRGDLRAQMTWGYRS